MAQYRLPVRNTAVSLGLHTEGVKEARSLVLILFLLILYCHVPLDIYHRYPVINLLCRGFTGINGSD